MSFLHEKAPPQQNTSFFNQKPSNNLNSKTNGNFAKLPLIASNSSFLSDIQSLNRTGKLTPSPISLANKNDADVFNNIQKSPLKVPQINDLTPKTNHYSNQSSHKHNFPKNLTNHFEGMDVTSSTQLSLDQLPFNQSEQDFTLQRNNSLQIATVPLLQNQYMLNSSNHPVSTNKCNNNQISFPSWLLDQKINHQNSNAQFFRSQTPVFKSLVFCKSEIKGNGHNASKFIADSSHSTSREHFYHFLNKNPNPSDVQKKNQARTQEHVRSFSKPNLPSVAFLNVMSTSKGFLKN